MWPQRSVLLTMGDYYGTLAAARHFGRMGFVVVLAEWRSFTPTGFSKYVTHTVRCPLLRDDKEFVQWLIEFGAKNSGYFLYPTSDNTAWLFAAHGHKLRTVFFMIETPLRVAYTLLNKRLLADLASECGIKSPELVAPDTEESLSQILNQLEGSWMLKPSTQIGLEIGYKGEFLDNNRRLEHFQEFRKKLRYRQSIIAQDQQVTWPIIQRFYPSAQDSIVSIAGYRHRDGQMTCLSAKKLMQFPRKFGVGICFEELMPEPILVNALAAMFLKIGYWGIFEAEFIRDEETGELLLIDVNPRFYGQMAFEIARGIPLPSLAYYDAIKAQNKDLTPLQKTDSEPLVPRCFGNMSLLMLVLFARFISFQMYPKVLWHWLKFCFSTQSQYQDAVYERNDLVPWFAEVSRTLIFTAKHPRSSWRKFFLST
ncbi:MAG: hypothetical protein NTX25_02730 [Proteobacteria bacterium]|nr:hypothetical protein [Pseudomonadota bacterium]